MDNTIRRAAIVVGAVSLAACSTFTQPPQAPKVATGAEEAASAPPKASSPPPVTHEERAAPPVSKPAAPAPAAKPKTPTAPKAAPAPPSRGPTKVAPAAAPKPEPPAAEPAAPKPALVAQAPAPKPAPLDLKTLEERLKDTSAIGVLTKLSLKNQVDDLVGQFRAYHDGKRPPTLAELRPGFELLLMKVLSLLQDKDAALAHDINASRDAIWGVLADKQKFAEFS